MAKDIALDAGRLDFYGEAKFDGILAPEKVRRVAATKGSPPGHCSG
ncbi:MAG TPA: hypothetical protein PLC55_13360 [Zoogloea sp.]|jgi:hypothetical protein|nr:hypothetical protein [Zoogloea sp.]